MKETVKTFIRRHHLIESGSTVLVAVSGGPDSMALLHFLKEVELEWKLTLKAVSVDHQLRGDASKADLLYVKGMCDRWNIEWIGTSVDVEQYKAEHGVGTQIAARELRYRFFAEQMVNNEADCLALGHHGDDQIETMLMGLVRSTSPRALSGMPMKRPFKDGQIIRPLLATTKQVIEAYCKSAGLNPRRDLSNEETYYTRNDFRKHVIPFLKTQNPNLHTSIQHLSDTLQADETHLYTEAETVFGQVVDFTENRQKAGFKIESFKLWSFALQRRVYHLILEYLYTEVPNDLSYKHESLFFDLLDRTTGNVTLDFPKQLQLTKTYGDVLFHFREKDLMKDYHLQLNVPGVVTLPSGASFTAKSTERTTSETRHRFICPIEQLILPLHIRTRRPGDRMSWKGLNGHKKLKDVLIDAKVPPALREEWPIVVDDHDDPIWLTGLRKSNFHKRTDTKGPYIQIDYIE